MTYQPDFERLLTVLWRRGEPDRVPFYELFFDPEVVAALLQEPAVSLPENPQAEDYRRLMQQRISLRLQLRYDYVQSHPRMVLPDRRHLLSDDTAELSDQARVWVDESHGIIESWADFERYPWPAIGEITTPEVDAACELVPEGMKLQVTPPGGVLENVMWLMGYVPMSMAMADEPDLVEIMFDRVGELLLACIEAVVDCEQVGVINLNDDLGFKSATLISPDMLRRYVFPWYRRMAEVVHAHGKPFTLHCCGNVSEIIDDIIDVPFEAKHSYEDVIMPVAEFKRRYGDRIAVEGGIDMHLLSSGSEEQVRQYTRRVMEECMPGGGWALGSGNSLANYVPVQNYLAMLDVGWELGHY